MQPTRQNRSVFKLGLGVALFVGAIAAAAFAFLRTGTDVPSTVGEPAIPSGAPIASWQDNGRDGAYLLRIASGRPLPRGATVHGVVTSDASCEPDAQGFSHCRNGIDLAGGARLVVVDTHQMSRHPCLTPGEDVRITGFNDQWAVLKL
ncbi:hypothetical protein KEX41_28640 (plasmid) [Burkholderia thailandensis]|uniref:hypothetical protein n=1 Tax=Burkholderia thailandensis TaxID=57975 RepID=UPI00192DD64D|nr:hypothetical protein [Burkholderia thailandensis]MBS2132155.1 hypothetical protein [Burkholderia thailandensis]QRA15258.1 hypothetical protein JMY07_29065 [Burkholderia thailandensis]